MKGVKLLDIHTLVGRFSPVDEVSDSVAKNLERGLGGVAHTDEKIEKKSYRVKTRFLGFKLASVPEIGDQIEDCRAAAEPPEGQAPHARLVIVNGAGRGHSFALLNDSNRIGRDASQEIQLAFGDSFVSRESHATIVYYGERDGFEILDGGRANPVLLNGRKLWRNEQLRNGDRIRVGETTLRFLEL